MQIAAAGLNQDMLPVFWGLLLAATIAWLFVSNRLYAALRQNYPTLYEMLGKPKLFMPKSLLANFKVIRFLFKHDYGATLDPAVMRLRQGLRALFCIYVICLAGCIALLLDKM